MNQTERQEAIHVFGRLLDTHCPRGTSADSIGVEDGQLWGALAAGGWLAVAATEDAGGSDLDLFDLALLSIEWGRRLPPLPFAMTALAHRWGRADAADPERKFSFGLPEANGILVPFPDANAPIMSDANNSPVDPFSPALPVMRVAGQTELSGEQVSECKLLFAAEALGAATQIFEQVTDYAQQRMAYGSPISGFQTIRHMMADMFSDLELANSAVFWAVSTTGEEREDAIEACVTRCQKVAADSLHIYGGIGFTWELGAHLYLRHTIAAREIATGQRRVN